jgi:hypothetical protein
MPRISDTGTLIPRTGREVCKERQQSGKCWPVPVSSSGQLDADNAGSKANTGPGSGKLGYVNSRLSYGSWSEATSHVPHRRGRRRPRGIGSKEQSRMSKRGRVPPRLQLHILFCQKASEEGDESHTDALGVADAEL